eukprot:CAMPEP_0194279176 /NCGR_PEP_ID=MMETSP0169-20130528/13555_1 /TAXON_ID=218684 /ORGANISM="Corethron pennatum, Strain L29A3" /LENGTH=138 /DNA_ID=CAMNT_0039023551 /DNA_START=76 /DNA_END=492 /DNA_ORIENTATION=-
MIVRHLASRVKSELRLRLDQYSSLMNQNLWQPRLCESVAGTSFPGGHNDYDGTSDGQSTSVMEVLGGALNGGTGAESIWLAVPKRKHTKSRKRMKITAQKRIPLKTNIIQDKVTGELTLMHHLSLNWKKFIPAKSEEK